MALEVFMQQGVLLHNKGLLDEAQNLYQKALALAPNNPSILNLLGLVAQAKGLDTLAIDYFYKALQTEPFNQEYNFSLGYSLDNLGRYQEAISCYQKASSVKEALNNIANIYKKQKEFSKAKEYYQKSLILDKNNNEAKAGLAFLDMNINALKSDTNNPWANYYLALNAFENNNIKESLSYLNNADNNLDFVNSLYGEIYFHQKDYKNSQIWLQNALNINPNNYNALVFMAKILVNNKEYNKAEKLYLKLIENNPQNLDIKIDYANLLFLTNNKVQSLEEYRKIIAINPNIAEVSNNLGVLLKEAQEYEEALGLFFNALSAKPTLEDVSVNILETLVVFEKEKACKIAQNWLKNYPDNIYAKHLVSRFEGKDCDNETFNAKLFNAFSKNYEEVLNKIEYKLPQKTVEIFKNIKGNVLDLGCGSGLLGELIKNNNNNLTGVDLSSEMIKKAQEKNVYNKLIVSSIKDFITNKNDFDYIFALDVFCYNGDLSNVINFIKTSKFLFSIELGQGADFEININGRYKHNPDYIKKLLKDTPYKSEEIVLRKENNKDVIGMIFYKLQ